MIRIVMLGRTGNNLFQYATGRVLAEKHGVDLVMDGSWFNHDDWEKTKLISTLPIRAKLTRPFSVGSKLLKKITAKHHWEYIGGSLYREPDGDTSYNPHVLQLPARSTLMGYFQSHLYFREIEHLLRQELSFSNRQLDSESAIIADEITDTDSVAIHVRRTDYIGNKNTEICDDAYYQSAIRLIRKTVANPHFHIFSDDPAWCCKHFFGDEFNVVDCHSSKTDPINDLHLMSLASHHIIANSSYSWWAAWLGKKNGQRVLMPPEWFRGIPSPIAEKQCMGWEIVTY